MEDAMKDKDVLNLPDESEEQARMLEILKSPEARDLLFSAVKKKEEGPAETDVERHLRKIAEAHTEEEVKSANEFCERTFENMIQLAQDNTTLELHWCKITASPRTKRMKLTKIDRGFIMRHWISLDYIALFYIDVILEPDGTIKGTDREVAWRMIQYSESLETPLHPEWRYILNPKKSGIASMELWTHEFS